MNLLEAVKAMDEGKIVQCLFNKWFYRKKGDRFEISVEKSFDEIDFEVDKFGRTDIESIWIIVGTRPKNCIWCGSPTGMHSIWRSDNEKIISVVCKNETTCNAISPEAKTTEEAIKVHNDMYNRLLDLDGEE